MHWTPVGRKFGGPEIALIAVALAFAIPMTAWWHGLYQQPEVSHTGANYILPAMQPMPLEHGTNVQTIAALGYFVRLEPTNAALALPAFGSELSRALTPVSDPNQTLLLVVALIGTVAAGVYSMAVYPALRR
jgi:hypothetical protein